MQTQVDELTLLIETLSKGKQKEMDLKDTIIDWSNVSLENPETPQKRYRETLESPQKSRYMLQSDVFWLRYDGYNRTRVVKLRYFKNFSCNLRCKLCKLHV